uniref:Uncharacterized protein n=1 Tax=Cacopsylla melanoneura TaxID=428564 RepID=A0A8D9F5T7_9HEMI
MLSQFVLRLLDFMSGFTGLLILVLRGLFSVLEFPLEPLLSSPLPGTFKEESLIFFTAVGISSTVLSLPVIGSINFRTTFGEFDSLEFFFKNFFFGVVFSLESSSILETSEMDLRCKGGLCLEGLGSEFFFCLGMVSYLTFSNFSFLLSMTVGLLLEIGSLVTLNSLPFSFAILSFPCAFVVPFFTLSVFLTLIFSLDLDFFSARFSKDFLENLFIAMFFFTISLG